MLLSQTGSSAENAVERRCAGSVVSDVMRKKECWGILCNEKKNKDGQEKRGNMQII